MSENACKEYQRRLKDALTGELPGEERRDLEEHLAGCASCRKEAAELRAFFSMVGEVEEEAVPRHFFIYEQGPGRLRGWLAWSPSGRWLAAAAAVLLPALLLVALNARVEMSGASFTLTLGNPVEREQGPDVNELVEQFRQVSREEYERWSTQLREEILQRIDAGDRERQKEFEGGMAELQKSFATELDERDRALRGDLTRSIQTLGNSLLANHQQDMNAVRWSLSRSARFDQLQVDQTDLIMTTLAELSVSQ